MDLKTALNCQYLLPPQPRGDDEKVICTFSNKVLPEVNFFRWNADMCDVIIDTEDGKSFPAHRAILCGCSSYFSALFSGPFATTEGHSSPKRIGLGSVSAETVISLLEFAYTGKLHLTASEIDNPTILLLADKLMVSSAIRICERFFVRSLDIANCVGVFLLSQQYHFPYLHHHARQFLLKLSAHLWHKSHAFGELSMADLQELLKDDELNVREEEDVLKFLFKWVRVDVKRRLPRLHVLITTTVRLGRCHENCLTFIANHNRLISEKPSLKLLLRKPRTSYPDNSYWMRARTPQVAIMTIGGWMTEGMCTKIEIYDPSANRWVISQYEDIGHPKSYHGVLFLNGFVYCLGGFDGEVFLSSVRRFDLMNCRWEYVANMHVRRCYGVYAICSYNKILAVGGFDGDKRTCACEMFDPRINTWFMVASLQYSRSDAAAANINEKVIVVGGFNGKNILDSVEIYHPDKNYWSLASSMISPRSGFALIKIKSHIFAVGGYESTTRLSSVECYNITTDTWSQVLGMKAPRSNFLAVSLNDIIYVIGGFDGNGAVNTMEIVWPFGIRTKHERAALWRHKDVPNMHSNRSAFSGCLIEGPGLRGLLYDDGIFEE